MSSADYGYTHAGWTGTDLQVLAAVERRLRAEVPRAARVLELGCGNGYFAARLAQLGYAVTAVDPSATGVACARAAHAGVAFEMAGVDELLATPPEPFDAVVSVDVIEHCPNTYRQAGHVAVLACQ